MLQKKHVSVRYLAVDMAVSEATVAATYELSLKTEGYPPDSRRRDVVPSDGLFLSREESTCTLPKQIIGQLAAAFGLRGRPFICRLRYDVFSNGPGSASVRKTHGHRHERSIGHGTERPGMEVISVGRPVPSIRAMARLLRRSVGTLID